MTPLFAVILFIWFFCSYFVTFFLISRVGGWSELASHYASDGTKNPIDRRMRSLSLGKYANYNNVVNLGADDQALYLSVLKIMSFAHADLRIPFRDLSVSEKTARFGGSRYLIIAKTDKLMRLSKKDFEWLMSVSSLKVEG